MENTFLLDALIALFSVVFMPIILGIITYLLTMITSRSSDKSFEEGFRVTKIAWTILGIGALIYLFL